uniref:Insulin receptor substrate 1-B-like n=1 Tax=Gouania willdenowi TaxID=441366 RepID=A0A8C5GT57_GOUWI
VAEPQSYEDVEKSGYLRKHKSLHRRFFVLRAASDRGPARIEYYENEKKFRSKSPVPKKVVTLEGCLNINKRADSRNKHMIVLYTRSESFAIAADSEEVQNDWYQAMLDLHSGECSSPSPIPTFKEVWQVKVWPKGLGHARNLVGIYRLCLTDKTVNFVKLNSDVASVVLQLMNVRRCGHSENFFFIEVGRSAITGPGEFWMQVDDSVVAQNMHETLLEAMKALSEEFRQRSKSQSVGTSCGGGTASNPISVPSRRHHPNLPPSQVGFSRRARTETPGSSTSTSPTSRHGFPRARTASIGARSEDSGASARSTWASSSPSLNGSCSTTPILSLSSSSGHGSECGLVGAAVGSMSICSYPRVPQRVSVSGSPSDYGSSDEYGSSPGEHSLLMPSLSGHPVHGEGSSSYIVMGQREGLLGSHHRSKGRRILRRASSRECEAERRLLSKRASLPLAPHERLAPHRKEDNDEDEEEYAIMSQNTHRVDAPECSGGGRAAEAANRKRMGKSRGLGDPGGALDCGYMSMLPGVTSPVSPPLSIGTSGAKAAADDEYMAMTPSNSVSPPQHIRQPSTEGYMLMSPNSSSSTDLHGLAMWDSRVSMESRVASDYMNISPVSSRSACSTPPSHSDQHQLQPKMFNSYFSLPRAYQHTGEGDGYSKRNKIAVGPAGGCQLSMSSSSFSSSSSPKQPRRARPSTVSSEMAKANTLPRVKENLAPSQTVGEYVSIVYDEDDKGSFGRPERGRPVIHGTFSAPLSTSNEYVSMDLRKSSTPLQSHVRSTFSPPAVAPKARKEPGPSSPLVAEGSAGYRAKVKMAAMPTDVPSNVPDSNVSARPVKHPGQPVSTEPEAGLGFSPIKAFRSPERSSRLVRGDQTGCLSHRRDAFNSPPSLPRHAPAPTALFQEGGQAAGQRRGLDCSPQASASSVEQGLNYIDLDLAQPGAEHAPPGGAVGLNTYASIDFYKSEELRAHHNRKDGPGKTYLCSEFSFNVFLLSFLRVFRINLCIFAYFSCFVYISVILCIFFHFVYFSHMIGVTLGIFVCHFMYFFLM